MEYQNVEEQIEERLKSVENTANLSVSMISIVEEIIKRANSWEKRIVVEKISDYLQEQLNKGNLEFIKIPEDKRLEVIRIMYSPKEYTEDLLLGKTPRIGMEFMFPYHLFGKGECVAIYGAGNTGRVIYRQASRDKYVKIVGIFDQNLAGLSIDDLIVRPIRELCNVKYDYILIAICDKKTVDNVKEKLLSIGVSENKIRWDGEVYHRDTFFRNFYLPMVKNWCGSRKYHKDILKEYNVTQTGSIYDHMFPYHLFHEGERVAIYGAGDIGRKFWKQGIADNFVNVVGIVDREADKIIVKGMPVKNIEALSDINFDSILISVHGPEEIILQIRDTLVKMGIEKEKIKWDGRTYYQSEFRRNVYLAILRALKGEYMTSTQMIGDLCRRIDMGMYENSFPYELFKKGERVVIYGAGKIGINLYRQARIFDYVDVVAIVDDNVEGHDEQDVPVLPLSAIKNAEPDAVLIAREKKIDAESAKKNLIDIGVPSEQIMWATWGYDRESYIEKLLKKLGERTKVQIEKDKLEGNFEI